MVGRKRWTAGMAVLVLVVALAACSDDDDELAEEVGTTAVATTEAPSTTEVPETTAAPETTEAPTTSEVDAFDWSDVFGIDFTVLGLPDVEFYDVDARESLVDEARLLQVVHPGEWQDKDLALGSQDDVDVPSIWVAPDLAPFLEGYDAPGLKLTFRSPSLEPSSVAGWLFELASLNATADNCAGSELFPYDDGIHEGTAELWYDCGDSGAALLHVATELALDFPGFLTLEVQMLDWADVDAAVTALETMEYLGYTTPDEMPQRSPATEREAAP